MPKSPPLKSLRNGKRRATCCWRLRGKRFCEVRRNWVSRTSEFQSRRARRNEMKTKICFACALLFLAAGLVRGEQPAPPPVPQPRPDPGGRRFFSPELVIPNQETIGLRDEQKSDLPNEIRHAQLKITHLPWKL